MGLKVGTTTTNSSSLHWSHPSVPHSPSSSYSSSQTLASAISSPSSSSKRRTCDGPLFCRYAERSALYGAHQQLYRSRSCHNLRSRVRTIRRALTASLSDDDEFSKQIQDLALRFQFTQHAAHEHGTTRFNESFQQRLENIDAKLLENFKPFDPLAPPDFPERDDIIPANIERKANSVDIPLSLRIIKRRKQWQEGFVEAGESAYCSVKKAFSSMVFIIRELHSYTLQMREVLFYEDLQGILASVQKEMHASFVWLFQKVFSQTPMLMMYVMILLANYSVYSMSSNVAMAATPQVYGEVSVVEDRSKLEQKFDSSIIRTIKLSSSHSGNTSSVGGNNGGGGKYKQVASGRDDDGRFGESNYNGSITPERLLSTSRTNGEESVSMQASHEEEVTLWKSTVEEASRMQAASRDESLDQETMQRFVSPVDAKIEAHDHSAYFKTELLYQTGLAQEPNSPLLLANYAQFLHLVAQDFDRAEEYFKRAAKVEPKDAEALNKYANFLWVVRKHLWAAEETYLEAIDAEPDNSYYAANYAHFLWNTGGEDTCFPLAS